MTASHATWPENSACGQAARRFSWVPFPNLGGQYVVGVNAVGCSSGETLAEEQEEAATKQEVLKGLE
jgi:hypothetical protein